MGGSVTPINTSRVLVGGLVAGLIMNVSEYVLNEIVLGAATTAELQAHNLPEIGGSSIALFVTMTWVVGIVLVWLYAAIRPRFGPGPKTAIIAAVAVWFLFDACPSIIFWGIGLFSLRLTTIPCVWSFFESLIAGYVGAMIYSESSVMQRSAV
jgi:hypothetical protein